MPTDHSVAPDSPDVDMNEDTNLIDHDDMFILDMGNYLTETLIKKGNNEQ